MQNIGTNSISFVAMNIFFTLVAIVFVVFVDTISIADTISSYVIIEVSGVLFKYLLFS